jgi:hypothetical protein
LIVELILQGAIFNPFLFDHFLPLFCLTTLNERREKWVSRLQRRKEQFAMNAPKQALVILLAGITIGLSGCQSVKNNRLDYGGVPGEEYLVGGGYHISYRARVEGDLFLAEEQTNRLLATITLEPGEKHEIKYDVNDQQMIANLQSLGIDPKLAVFKLYFVPR